MLKRECLRQQICDEVRSRIVRGDFAGGKSLVETELAMDLGVSRTPLREALITLEQEGFLVASPGKGFSVLPLNHQEYRDMVEIIGAMEELALRCTPVPTPEQIAELRSINDSFKAAEQYSDSQKRISECVRLDILWHSVLLENSRNEKALALLATLKEQWRRYEYSFFSSTSSVEVSFREHVAIIDTLERGERDVAAGLLNQQWKSCELTEEFFELREGRI